MVRLQDDSYSKVAETIRALAQHPSFTSELGDKIRKPDGATRAVNAMLNEFFPPTPTMPPSVEARDEAPGSRQNEVFSERYRIDVAYKSIPSASELGKRFDHVDFGDYTHNDWAREGWISDQRLSDGKQDLLVRSFCVKMRSENVLQHALQKGYRLGLLQEALDLVETCPDLQRRCRIVVLGSTIILKQRSVAVLCGDRSRREFRTMSINTQWEASDCFLLVKEDVQADRDIEKFIANFPSGMPLRR